METSEVLYKAADLIESRGWTRGTVGWKNDGPLCLEGGIVAALGGSWADVTMNDSFQRGGCPAYEAVKSYLDPNTYRVPMFGMDDERVWIWNDTHGRTASEVIEVLRAAAVIEAARENAEARTQVSA